MSRSLNDLRPEVRPQVDAFLEACAAAGIDILVTATSRTNAEQAALFAQGRTAPGPKVTNAPAASYVNNLTGASGVTNKYLGRQCYDTTNTRLMIAQGSTDTSNWERADGGASVTPS